MKLPMSVREFEVEVNAHQRFDKPLTLVFPNPIGEIDRFKCDEEFYGLRINAYSMWQAIKGVTGVEVGQIAAVAVFGSALNQAFKMPPRRKYWWCSTPQPKRHSPPPNDLDVLVLIKDDTMGKPSIGESLLSVGCDELVEGYNGLWWELSLRSDFLHIFFMRECDFKEHLRDGTSEALSIVKKHALICGELPVVKAGRVSWMTQDEYIIFGTELKES